MPGCNLRDKPLDVRKFYPDDNYLEAGERTGRKLIVNLSELIAGIDKE